jgi:ribosomal protein L10
VAKNTLIQRALDEIGDKTIPEGILVAPTAIIFAYDDAVAPAKLIKAQFEKFNKPVFKAAVLEGQFFGPKQLNTLASLPGKKEIISSILGSLQAPVSGMLARSMLSCATWQALSRKPPKQGCVTNPTHECVPLDNLVKETFNEIFCNNI